MKSVIVIFVLLFTLYANADEPYAMKRDPSKIHQKYTNASGSAIVSIAKNKNEDRVAYIHIWVNGKLVEIEKKLYQDLRDPCLGSLAVSENDDGTLFVTFAIKRADNGVAQAWVTFVLRNGKHVKRTIKNDETIPLSSAPTAPIVGTLLASSCSSNSILVNLGTAELSKPTRITITPTTVIFSQKGRRIRCDELSFSLLYIWPNFQESANNNAPIEATAVLVAD
jgi:hypothetical protein